MKRSRVRNHLDGDAAAIVQAGHITGNVYMQTGAAARTVQARPVTEWNPFDLGVHKAITLSGSDGDLPDLPGYLRRAHDDELETCLGDLTQSLMVVASGESSTGKTRALYELVHSNQSLREWPLLYPRTADELLRLLESGQVEARMVLWLNETHNHLSGPTGDLAAAALRVLLDGSGAGPVVVLGTLWPQFWSEFVVQPRGGKRDEHANARALLQQRARRVRVAGSFTTEEIAAVRATRAVDPRLAAAASASGDGRHVIQTMAGGPALVDRYEYPDDSEDRYAAAIVAAAIDARRLGHQELLPLALLADAAGGYLDERDRADPPPDWFAKGLAKAATDAILGVTALTARRKSLDAGPADGYELHDYLDQHGRGSREASPVPVSLWRACLAHTTAISDLLRLSGNAYRRLVYRYADPMIDRILERVDTGLRDHLVDLLAEYGRIDKAVSLLEPPQSDDPEPRIPSYRVILPGVLQRSRQTVVNELIAWGRVEDARTLLLALLESDFQTWWVSRKLMALLIGQGQIDEALALLQKPVLLKYATERDRNRPIPAPDSDVLSDESLDVRYQLANALADHGRWEEALQIVRSTDSDWAPVWLARQLARSAQLERLRSLADMANPEVSATLWEALFEHGQVTEALDRFQQYPGNGAPSARLLELLVRHGHVELAIDTAMKPGNQLPHSATLRALADSLIAHGERDRLLQLLRQLASDSTDREDVADLLADQGLWVEALDIARGSHTRWAESWLPRRLAMAGNIAQLRRLVMMGNEHAGRELARLLPAQEALEMVREHAESDADWAYDELASLLAQQRRYPELEQRARAGDRYASMTLIALAQQGKLPDSAELMERGLESP